MRYDELNPTDSNFNLDDQEFEIRAFDIAAQVWAYNEFATDTNEDGLAVLSDRIRNLKDAEAILKLTWHLLRRKPYFGTYNNFLKVIEKDRTKENFWLKITDLYQAVNHTLGVSQPMLEEMQEELELKKSLAAQG